MKLIQISAGRGPLECSWIVGKVSQKLLKEAKKEGFHFFIIEAEEDIKQDTYKSVIISISGEEEETFLSPWLGTIQWIVQSPFRPNHKRKNWFVAVHELPQIAETEVDMKDIRVDTMRASGAGGQHVNKTESAVRLTHIPSQTTVSVSSQRSQHQNKSVALTLLMKKIEEKQKGREKKQEQENWQNHNELVRGNPVKVFKE